MSRDNRRHARAGVEGMHCSLGHLLDLSHGGAKLLSPRALSGGNTLVLHTARTGKLRLRVQVQWRRRLAFREHLVGVRFEQLGTVDRRALANLVDQAARGVAPATLQRRGRGLAAVLLLLGVLAAALGYVSLERPDDLVRVWPGWVELDAAHRRLAPLGALGVAGLLLVTGAALALRRPAPAPRRTTADRRHDAAPGRRATRGPNAPDAPDDAVNELITLRRGQHVLNTILESSLNGIAVLHAVRDADRTLRGLEVALANPAAGQLVGRDTTLLIGRSVADALPCLRDDPLYADLVSVIESGLPLDKHYTLGEPRRWYQVTGVQLGDGLTVTFADTTEQHQAQDKLRHVAYHDELTKLPNRKLLMEHLERAFHRAKRFADHQCAVLFLDFDRFKFVNDTLGHDIGDLLLINIARRLRENLRAADTAAAAGKEQVSARLGGDEFVVLLDGIRDVAEVEAVARRLLDAFNQPHQLDGHTVVSTASIGIAVSRDEYTQVDELLRDADTAMYQAKHAGKARYVVFDQHMHEKLLAEAQMEKDLRHAVAEGGFALAYEPIVAAADGSVAGFEALLRWDHPERGAVAPSVFLKLATELNLALPLGEWAMREALGQLARWREAGHGNAVLHLNLSKAQLYDEPFARALAGELERLKLPADRVRLEVSETLAMHDPKAVRGAMDRLKATGVGLALDDFGTGHSSLKLLQDLPLDVLKLDKALIANAGGAARHYGSIIASITELARNLGLHVVAEGIERPEQLGLVRSIRCDLVQGYLFGRAVEGGGALSMLNEARRFDALAA